MVRTKVHGFSLLEVNMAMAILALGMGGIMTSYLAVGHRVQYGYQQQQAQLIIEQMVAVLPLYGEHITWLQGQSTSTHKGQHCWRGQVCDQQQMLKAWWAYWEGYIAKYLPAGKCSLTCQGACISGGRLQIQISWQGGTLIPSNCESRHCLTIDWPL